MPERPRGASPTRATERSCDCSCSQVRRLVRLVCSTSWAIAERGSGGRRTGSVSAAHVASVPGARSQVVRTWCAPDNLPCFTLRHAWCRFLSAIAAESVGGASCAGWHAWRAACSSCNQSPSNSAFGAGQRHAGREEEQLPRSSCISNFRRTLLRSTHERRHILQQLTAALGRDAASQLPGRRRPARATCRRLLQPLEPGTRGRSGAR